MMLLLLWMWVPRSPSRRVIVQAANSLNIVTIIMSCISATKSPTSLCLVLVSCYQEYPRRRRRRHRCCFRGRTIVVLLVPSNTTIPYYHYYRASSSSSSSSLLVSAAILVLSLSLSSCRRVVIPVVCASCFIYFSLLIKELVVLVFTSLFRLSTNHSARFCLYN